MTSFFIETYGCSHNFADSEQMAGLLQEAKFVSVEKLEDADIIIINTCTVKTPEESGFFTRLEKLTREHPYKTILIAGCISQTNPEKLKKYPLVGTRSLHHIVEVVEEALNDNIIKSLELGEMPPLNLPRIRKNPVIEIIPISRGCLSECSFCKVKEARSALQSYPIEEIVTIAQKAVTQGVKEIWLTSQDCFCYGFDLGTNLPNLLKELIKIPGQFMVRIGMGNPVNLTKIKAELFPLFKEEKLFKYLHAPVQSGSNKILQNMNRGYTQEEFSSLVQEIKMIVPEINLATDIIVGYPTEKEEDYWETLNLFRKINPTVANISRFWPRSKTPAAKLKMLPGPEIHRRLKVLNEIFQNIAKLQNERWLDWQGNILIDEKVEKKEELKTTGKSSEEEKKEVSGELVEENKSNDKKAELAAKALEAKPKEKPDHEKMRFEKPFLEQPPEEKEEIKTNENLPPPEQWIGRNDSYKPITLSGNFKLGDLVKVKVVKTTIFELFGEVI